MPEAAQRNIRDAFLGAVIAVAVAAPVSAVCGVVFASMAAWGAATMATINALGDAVNAKVNSRGCGSSSLKAEGGPTSGDPTPHTHGEDEMIDCQSDDEDYDWREHQKQMLLTREGRYCGCCARGKDNVSCVGGRRGEGGECTVQ